MRGPRVENKWKILLSRPNTRRDWIICSAVAVMVIIALVMVYLDQVAKIRGTGIVWPTMMILAVLTLDRRLAK